MDTFKNPVESTITINDLEPEADPSGGRFVRIDRHAPTRIAGVHELRIISTRPVNPVGGDPKRTF